MQSSDHINSSAIPLLAALSRCGECNYRMFRTKNNPWRTEAYFDGEVKKMSRNGFLFLTGRRTIQITKKGKEYILNNKIGAVTWCKGCYQ